MGGTVANAARTGVSVFQTPDGHCDVQPGVPECLWHHCQPGPAGAGRFRLQGWVGVLAACWTGPLTQTQRLDLCTLYTQTVCTSWYTDTDVCTLSTKHITFQQTYIYSSPTATPVAPNFWMNKIQNCLYALQHNHRFCPLLYFWATTPLQSFPLTLVFFVRHTPAQTPTLQLQTPWLSHCGLHIWNTVPPPRHQALRLC